MTWTIESQKDFDFYNLVKLFTVQNRLGLGSQLPMQNKLLINPKTNDQFFLVFLIRLKMQELDIMVFIQLIVYALLGESITVLCSRQLFDESIL